MSDKELLNKVTQRALQVLPAGSHLFLYGSRARNDAHSDSDWDMLILHNQSRQMSDEDYGKYIYPLQKIGFDAEQYFSILDYPYAQWEAMSFTPFYKNVEHDKIQLL